MDEDVWEEIRYYESERDDARWRRDKLEEEIEDLEKKYEKNKELTKQYKKFVSDIKLAQDEISVSESYKKNALNNFNKNFKGELAKEKLKKYNTAFENMSTIKNNLKTCIDEGNTKIQKLAIFALQSPL